MKRIFIAIIALVLMMSFTLMPSTANAASYDSSVVLENKDYSDWSVKSSDVIQGTLEFNSSGSAFDYRFAATGLVPSTDYCLIYYADFEDRISQWGGDNPGMHIATITTDVSGNYVATAGSVDLGMDLPSSPDANICIHDYCQDPDNYVNCHGAKIWLVPACDYSISLDKVMNWNPSTFLFETELIWYDDTDITNNWGCASSAQATTIIDADTISISVSPNTFDFGLLKPTECSVGKALTITNTGTVDVVVTASTSSDFYQAALQLYDGSVYLPLIDWNNTNPAIVTGCSLSAPLKICVPYGYSAGTQTGTIVFWAE